MAEPPHSAEKVEGSEGATGSRVALRLAIGVAVWTVGVTAGATVLAGLSVWTPVVASVWALIVAGVAWRATRRLPPPPIGNREVAVVSALALCAAVAVGLTHAQNVIVNRDPSAYFQNAVQLSTNHETPVRVPVEGMGGPTLLRSGEVTLTSLAFYQEGDASQGQVQPQFLTGVSALFSLGLWAHNDTGAWWVAPIYYGLCILLVGLYASAFIARRWGAIASVATAAAYPLVYTARSTFSEPVALLVLLGAAYVFSLATQLHKDDSKRAGRLVAMAGVLVGGSGFIRIDVVRDAVGVYVLVGVLTVLGFRYARLLAPWMMATLLAAVLTWLWLSPVYLWINRGALVAATLALIAAFLVAVATEHVVRRKVSGRAPARLAWAAASTVLVSFLVLLSRPLWMRATSPVAGQPVAAAQAAEGLPLDPYLRYTEYSVVWTSWWVGWPVVVGAVLVVAVALYRGIARSGGGCEIPPWFGPAVVGYVACIAVWTRPGIMPDHPWADRRLSVVVPVVVLASVGGSAWLVTRVRRRSRSLAGVAAILCAGAIVVPPASASAPLWHRTQPDTLDAVRAGCGAFGDHDVALAVDQEVAYTWPQVLRGTCDTPAMSLADTTDPAGSRDIVSAVSSAVRSRGGELVLVAADAAPLRQVAPGSRPELVFDLVTPSDPLTLTRRPTGVRLTQQQLWVLRVGH